MSPLQPSEGRMRASEASSFLLGEGHPCWGWCVGLVGSKDLCVEERAPISQPADGRLDVSVILLRAHRAPLGLWAAFLAFPGSSLWMKHLSGR